MLTSQTLQRRVNVSFIYYLDFFYVKQIYPCTKLMYVCVETFIFVFFLLNIFFILALSESFTESFTEGYTEGFTERFTESFTEGFTEGFTEALQKVLQNAL